MKVLGVITSMHDARLVKTYSEHEMQTQQLLYYKRRYLNR